MEQVEKNCPKCKTIKPRVDFYEKRDGSLSKWCAQCIMAIPNKKPKEPFNYEQWRASKILRGEWVERNPLNS